MKIAIILSGCGVFDGSEIHEATMCMYSTMKNGGQYELFAPNINQHHVINHLTGEQMNETRNVLVESARIGRGEVKALSELNMQNFDALLLPGGFGAAKNLSDFAFKGAYCNINSELENIIRDAVSKSKPIGALCISPVILAKVLPGATVTIGDEENPSNEIIKMGSFHKNTTHGEIIIDEKYKIVTTPCYMLDANIVDIAVGADNVVKALIKMSA